MARFLQLDMVTPEGTFDYLASPYSADSFAVRQRRYRQARHVAARLMQAGFSVFAPVPYTHNIEVYEFDEVLPFAAFWSRQDLPILRCAGRLLILRLSGWAVSKGIQGERIAAAQWGIPEYHVDPQMWGVAP